MLPSFAYEGALLTVSRRALSCLTIRRLRRYVPGIADNDFIFHQIQAAKLSLIFGLDSHDINKGQLVRLYADVRDIAAQEGFSLGPVFIYC